MAITDLANAVELNIPWRTCHVCHALTSLPTEQAAALRILLANPSIRYSDLSAALATDEDYPLKLKSDTLSRHARGLCDAGELLRAA